MIVGYIESEDAITSESSVKKEADDPASTSDLSEQRLRLLRAKEKAARANAEAERAIAAAKRADAEALLAEVAAKRAEAEALHAEAAAKRSEADLATARIALSIASAEQEEEPNNETEPGPSTNSVGSQRSHNHRGKTCPACDTSGHNVHDCQRFNEADLDEKLNIVKREKLCIRCLRGWTKNHKCKAKKCNIDGCNSIHNPLLHKYKAEEVIKAPFQAHTYLMVVPVTVKGPAAQVKTWAISGSAAEVSLIDSALAEQVGAVGPRDPLHANRLFAPIDAPESRRVTLTLIGARRSYRVKLNTMDDIKLLPHNVRDEDIAHCEHLRDIRHLLATDGTVTPKILLGADCLHLFAFEEVRRGEEGQPRAVHTPLGWLITGDNDRVPRQNNYVTSSLLIRKR